MARGGFGDFAFKKPAKSGILEGRKKEWYKWQ
jgi:hypothetical protein